MGREWNSQRRTNNLSWVLFRSNTQFFRNFFEVNLLYKFHGFSSILDGFQEGLGRPTSSAFCWICLWRPYFWSNFDRILIKQMAKNIGIFSEFSTRRFINCCLNLLISSMLETSKIVIFLRKNAYFYKISFFAFDVKRYRTCTQS